MNERLRFPPEADTSPSPQEVSTTEQERIEGEFFQASSPQEKEVNQEQARSIFDQMRSSPLVRPLFAALAIFLGTEASQVERSRDQGSDIEVALHDPGVQKELKKLVLDELYERDHVRSEYEGRWGRDQWSTQENIEYADIPQLSGKFEYLHKDNPELVEAYRSPEGRLKSFKTIMELMSIEFAHSSLPIEFARTTIADAPEVLKSMEPNEALALYNEYSQDLVHRMGVRSVRELSAALVAVLPDSHPVVKQIQTDGWLGAEVEEWLKPSKENSMLFDQGKGRVLISHYVGDRRVLLDVFPGNGGPPNGVEWERGMPAHTAVKTPDGNYTFDQMFEKKSASWQFSWVTDTAPLRWSEDGKEVDYQDTDGKWRRLTGENAEFVVYGAPQKPFKDKTKSTLYQWSSERLKDGTWKRPAPFTIEDALDADGLLRPAWDRNDFGPQSIQIKDAKGIPMSIFFHSSPQDEGPQQFLEYSHGCIRMKPADLERAGRYLVRGSKIRISSFEDLVAVTPIEKPGTMSEPRG